MSDCYGFQSRLINYFLCLLSINKQTEEMLKRCFIDDNLWIGEKEGYVIRHDFRITTVIYLLNFTKLKETKK